MAVKDDNGSKEWGSMSRGSHR